MSTTKYDLEYESNKEITKKKIKELDSEYESNKEKDFEAHITYMIQKTLLLIDELKEVEASNKRFLKNINTSKSLVKFVSFSK
jgi:hypothetical protein